MSEEFRNYSRTLIYCPVINTQICLFKSLGIIIRRASRHSTRQITKEIRRSLNDFLSFPNPKCCIVT